ncbi:MAG: HAMP domain-containing protein [Deltaproteobacteria bacterium]|nr:HAMP domain-containing protein [Deltaproteobacteria bacterium]
MSAPVSGKPRPPKQWSLFTRMFAAFALVTVATTTFVSAYWDSTLARRQAQRVLLVSDALRLHGPEALALHDEGDDEGARRVLDALAAETDLRMTLIDGETRVVSIGEVPEAAIAIVPEGDALTTRTNERDQTWLVLPSERASDTRIVAVATPVQRSLRELRIVLLILATALASFFLARLLTRPIVMLRKATHRIAEGDTSVRVGEVAGAGEEIAGLAADFDRMTERIEDLLASREALLRDVSHELRSPLARLQVALGIARKRAAPDLVPLLDRMERETERLGELIGLVLSMARLEQAKDLTAPTEVRLDELVDSLASDASFEAEARDRAVSVRKKEPISVRGDAELLRQAAENVVRNAVRFAPAGTDVEIELVRVAEDVELRVRDHGPGVPETALAEIFRPFTRVDEARDRASGGAGIGLAITERAVRLHGGSVIAANADGGGLRVTIRLPAVA